MANDNLYTQDQESSSNNSSQLNKKDTGKNNEKNLFGQGAKTIGGLKDTANDMWNAGKSFANGAIKSIEDKFKPKSKRNNYNDSDFLTEDVSIENRHKDAIVGILKDTYNGNLWDAGVSAVNLYNVGTKWKIHLDQWVDKDAYSFKYWYYLESDLNSNTSSTGRIGSESNDKEGTKKLLSFLDTIEDPTVLSVSFRIDPSSSLFRGAIESKPNPTPNNRVGGESPDNTQKVPSSAQVTSSSSLTDFITNYQRHHKELSYALDYLSEFQDSITKIFESPETLDGNEFKTRIFKNHYIFKVDGLDKLDNLFVEYKSTEDKMFGTEQETLTFVLNEDVRMFSNRMAFLYRNLTYSYNMGKKLIPENLLRFNLYIKISDMRNFTRHTSEDDNLRAAMRNDYSRVIYELKDCEFFFPQSLNPSSLTIAGFNGINTDYSTLQMKIKYRKVNRIFYSSLYDANYSKFILGDKFYSPNLNNNKTFLNETKYGGKNTQKRPYSTNNIGKEPGLGEKLDTLKNRGLFDTDNNDTALGRFAKTIGNEAVKAGAQVVSDGVQSLKNQINTKIGGSVRSFLQDKVAKKTIDLGYRNNKPKQVREIKTNMSIQTPLTDVPEFRYNVNDSGIITNVAGIPSSATYIYNSNTNPKSTVILDVNNPLFTHKNNDEGKVLIGGTTDAYTNTKYKYDPEKNPNSKVIFDKNNPFERHTNQDFGDVLIPGTTDAHTNTQYIHDTQKSKLSPEVLDSKNPIRKHSNTDVGKILVPGTTDAYTNTDYSYNPEKNPNSKVILDVNNPLFTHKNNDDGKVLVPGTKDAYTNKEYKYEPIEPSEDLHPDKNHQFINPNEDVHPNMNYKFVNPNEDLHPELNNQIVNPNEDLHPTLENNMVAPKEDLHATIEDIITNPDDNGKAVDLHPKTDYSTTSPNEDLHLGIKSDIKSPNEDLMEGNGEIEKPNANVNGENDFEIKEPNGNVNSKVKDSIVDPKKDDVHSNVNHTYIQPDEFPDLKSFKDYLKKNKGGKNI